MRAAQTLLHYSPARREDYASTGTAICPLNVCATRYKMSLV